MFPITWKSQFHSERIYMDPCSWLIIVVLWCLIFWEFYLIKHSKMALTNTELPTLYEYYTAGGIQSGLSVDQKYFTLNERNITLYSGSLHYFRCPKKYWRDRLRQYRAAGLNAIETYVPWNLHEPEPGKFDFGSGGSDFEDLLDIEEFLKTVQEEDLFAIVRTGPFIGAEWEFGGLPSWLLREKDYYVRTSSPKFMEPVKRYFNVLLPILAALQFINGGPIILFQLEDEYGVVGEDDIDEPYYPDPEYLRQLRQLTLDNNITTVLCTTDDIQHELNGTLPELFYTVNFADDITNVLDRMSELRPNQPLIDMEIWTGWFDHWGEEHAGTSVESDEKKLRELLDYPASLNMYMFFGGTDFGFMNGANCKRFSNPNSYKPQTSSYDYSAPLNEAGQYTEKYTMVSNLIEEYNTVKTKLPVKPTPTDLIAYEPIKISAVKNLSSLLETLPSFESEKLISMEELPINNGAGQQYGYIVYEKKGLDIEKNSKLKIEGRVCDTVMVLIIDNENREHLVSPPLMNTADLKGFGYWKKINGELIIKDKYEDATLRLVVENMGRINYGKLKEQFVQYKGLWQGDVLLNNEVLNDWTIYPLEFKKNWTNSLDNWEIYSDNNHYQPGAFKAELNVDDPNADTLIDMRQWRKGFVAVNGFVLGRFSCIGPQTFLYLPAPYLKSGLNEILIFEHFGPSGEVSFITEQSYDMNFCVEAK